MGRARNVTQEEVEYYKNTYGKLGMGKYGTYLFLSILDLFNIMYSLTL